MLFHRRNKKVVVTRTQYRPPHDHFPFAFSLSATSSRLVHASEPRDRMFVRIGMMRALNRHVERVFNSERKDHHWGKRKLARDR
jgi:hypothetical protein